MSQGSPNFAITPVSGAAILSAGDTSRTNPTGAQVLLTAGSAGTRVERVTFQALGANSATVLRLFKFDGTNHHLINETAIAATTTPAQGAALASGTFEAVTAPNIFPELLPVGWSLKASINDGQVLQEAALASIAASQTTGAAGYLALNGASVTAANTTSIAAAAAPTAATPYTLTATPAVLATPAQVTLTSASNVSAVNFTIVGRDATGAQVSEVITGPNATTVYTVNVYKAILAIVPSATNAGTVSAGVSPIAGLAVLPAPSKLQLFSAGNLSAINFTITGTTPAGQVLTEVLAGPNATAVQSVNVYASVTSIRSSAAVTTAVQVGSPAILGGFKVTAMGGNF